MNVDAFFNIRVFFFKKKLKSQLILKLYIQQITSKNKQREKIINLLFLYA